MEIGYPAAMTLLNSEHLIYRLKAGNAQLVLTSHRVCHGSDNGFTSIRLEEVGSVALARMAHRWMLAAVGVCVAIAIYLVCALVQADGAALADVYRRLASALLFVSALLVIAFNITRFTRIQIASPGANIEVRFRSLIAKEIRRFVQDLEDAKDARYVQADRAQASTDADRPAHNLPPPSARQWRTG